MMPQKVSLHDNVRYIKGVGPKRAKAFQSLGIETVQDLLDYRPFRIDDFSQVKKLKHLQPGDRVTIAAKVSSVAIIPSLRGRALRVGVTDGTGTCYLVWYNMPYLYKRFYRGLRVIASGKIEWRRNSWEIAHPLWKEAGQASANGLIVPIYHGKANLSSSMIARFIKQVLNTHGHLIPEILPEELVDRHELLSQRKAYENIHCPSNAQMWSNARRTFAFREVFLLQLALLLMKSINQKAKPVDPFNRFALPEVFVESLPFELIEAQKRTIHEISEDLCSGKTMNRLIQGDVGSGKTVVAVWALLTAVDNGYQAALLAPTEVLARQHLVTVRQFAKDLASIGFLSGSLSASEKRRILDRLHEGSIDILIGTHAMLEPTVKWRKLGLVVTDEQHRFGVKERLSLSYDTRAPHMLVMSATPIPRSMALTLFGDLDISVIDQLPHGRKRVHTQVLGYESRKLAYERIRQEVEKGYQAYVVCPLIREGKSGRMAAEEVFKELQSGYLHDVNIGLAHGDMPRDELVRQTEDFARGRTQVLVATTVIEVGVDVRNASCMVIEGAEAFGLATLHQLRGRVGRGNQQSYCFLIPSEEANHSLDRIRILENTHDGFSVAEMDLRQRGPGQFFGVKQHGLSDINIEELDVTQDIIYHSRHEAKKIVNIIEKTGQVPLKFSPLFAQVEARFGNLLRHARSR